MGNKRGMLAIDEIVKLIIGICVLIFIIFLLFAFGGMVSSSFRQEQAKNTLDNIVYEINKVNLENIRTNHSAGSFEFLVESPKDWIIMYNNSNQICICDSKLVKNYMKLNIGQFDSVKTQYEVHNSCVNLGICEKVPASYLTSSSCSGLLGLRVEKIEGCYILDKVPANIRIGVDKGLDFVVAPPTNNNYG